MTERKETITFSMTQALQPQEGKIAAQAKEFLLQPAGGLTYCISAGKERTSNFSSSLPSK